MCPFSFAGLPILERSQYSDDLRQHIHPQLREWEQFFMGVYDGKQSIVIVWGWFETAQGSFLRREHDQRSSNSAANHNECKDIKESPIEPTRESREAFLLWWPCDLCKLTHRWLQLCPRPGNDIFYNPRVLTASFASAMTLTPKYFRCHSLSSRLCWNVRTFMEILHAFFWWSRILPNLFLN